MKDKLNILLKKLTKTRDEWQNIADEQGDDWDESERQLGEIDGIQHAINCIEELINKSK